VEKSSKSARTSTSMAGSAVERGGNAAVMIGAQCREGGVGHGWVGSAEYGWPILGGRTGPGLWMVEHEARIWRVGRCERGRRYGEV
jgi:hypothetical protein